MPQLLAGESLGRALGLSACTNQLGGGKLEPPPASEDH